MNLSHAATNALGVLRSPNPYTVRPDSRSRAARRVKSLSLETRQNPSNRPEYSRSMASITIAESVEFFPVVYANCCTGWIDWASSRSFHPFRLVPVQSPYARLTCAVPYLATSASRSSMIAGCALSASISTASLAAFSLNHRLLPPLQTFVPCPAGAVPRRPARRPVTPERRQERAPPMPRRPQRSGRGVRAVGRSRRRHARRGPRAKSIRRDCRYCADLQERPG